MTSLKSHLDSNDLFFKVGELYSHRAFIDNASFEHTYLELRRKENRVHSDALVETLPEVPETHPCAAEWAIRRRSAHQLVTYLHSRKGIKKILEVGCGNGWLSSRLSVQRDAEVCGIDINRTELLQAASVFRSDTKLYFLLADVFASVFPNGMFDIVVLASSAQYFPDLKILVTRLLDLVTPTGEIHIMDTPLYDSQKKAAEAKERSIKYFQSLECPSMASHYFHHTFDELQGFETTALYDPTTFASRLRRKLGAGIVSPFPWIRITRA